MTSDSTGAPARLSYQKIRDVTTKEEELNGAQTYVVVMPAKEILKIGTDGNLRSYIPAHEGKKRNLVHKAIRRTIEENPDRFSQLNSGFLIGASKITVDDQKKIVILKDASVNNGAQSQGEITEYFATCEDLDIEPNEFSVRCEISVEPDASTRTTIAVARNTATKIEGVSIAGRYGYFEEIDQSFRKWHPKKELARSETDVEDHFVDTRQLLQVMWALMPQEITPDHRRSTEARMRAYKNAAYCLQDFMTDYDERKTSTEAAARFKYFVDMAGPAWKEYERWKKLDKWNDKYLLQRLKQATRSDDGAIKEVSDGIVFPILAALSSFVKRSKSGVWHVEYPKVFQDDDMLLAARRQLSQCSGRPMLMGRSGGAYEALATLTEMANRYSAQLPAK